MIYTMDIEKPAGVVKQHGFHLGTDKRVAEQFVLERLRADPAILSIALRRDGECECIYDLRDIQEGEQNKSAIDHEVDFHYHRIGRD